MADALETVEDDCETGVSVTTTVFPGAMLVTTEGCAVVAEGVFDAWALERDEVAAAADDDDCELDADCAEDPDPDADPDALPTLLEVPVRYTDQKPLAPQSS